VRHTARITLACLSLAISLVTTAVTAAADTLTGRWTAGATAVTELDFGDVCVGTTETIEFDLVLTRHAASTTMLSNFTYGVWGELSAPAPPGWSWATMITPTADQLVTPADWAVSPDGTELNVGRASLTMVGDTLGSWSGNAVWTAFPDTTNTLLQLRHTIAVLPYSMNVVECALEASGFLPPVRTGSDVTNVVKGGATVPLKFTVTNGEEPVTDLEALDPSISLTPYRCDTSDERTEITCSPGTTTTLQVVDGEFVQHWRTPTAKGCYRLALSIAPGVDAMEAQFQVR